MAPIPFRKLIIPWLVLSLIVLINGLLWIHIVPGGRAPDEVNHQRVVHFIASQGRLPVLNQDIKIENLPIIPDPYVTHPPGGYIVSALLLNWIPGWRSDIPARYGSLLCLILTVPVMMAIVRVLLPKSFACQVAVPATCLLIPQVTFVGAYTNSDAFGLLTGTLFAYALCLGACRNEGNHGWRWLNVALFGGAAGLVILSRYNSFALLPVFGIGFLISAWVEYRRWHQVASRAAVALSITTLIVSPWLIFNYQHYKELLPLKTLWNAQTEVHGRPYTTPRDDGYTYLSLLTERDWISSTFKSFFGNFEYMSVPLPGWMYSGFAVVSILSLLGLVCGLVFCNKEGIWRFSPHVRVFPEAATGARFANTFFFLGFLSLAFIALHVALTRDYQAQGRYLFPGLLGVVLLGMMGLHVIVPNRFRPWLPWVVAGSMALSNIYASTQVIIPEYPELSKNSLIPALHNADKSSGFRLVREKVNGRVEHGVFIHGGSSCTFNVIPESGRLVGKIGLMPDARNKSDGVRFRLRLREAGGEWEILLDQEISPHSDWLSVNLDVSRYVGKLMTLEFYVDPGPTNAYDWAVFINPVWAKP